MMHPDLASRLKRLREYNRQRQIAERKFRVADGGKKPFFAQLFLKLTHGSVAEREHKVYASLEWIGYIEALAQAETDYNYQDLEFQIQLNAFYAELSAFKKTIGDEE